MMKRYLICLLLGMVSTSMWAKVKLPHLISDNMLLQQQQKVRLWGWDKPGKQVVVVPSWNKKRYTTRTNAQGEWEVEVETPRGSYQTYTLSFDDGEMVKVKNVAIGEVWVCAGQSNMEMPMRGFDRCPTENFMQEMMAADTMSAIRFVKIPSVMSTKPLKDAVCQWKMASRDGLPDVSAVGYFFAKPLQKALHVPVGLILSNKGGSRVESWLNREYLAAHTQEPLDSATFASKFRVEFYYPMLWGYGTFAPILNYTVKGVLYYQGCSNVGDPDNQYATRLAALAKQWREGFRQPNLPFYYVQITPFWYNNVQGTAGAKLREQQFNAQQLIPHSGLVCTDDLVYSYEKKQIHPAQKQAIGERLALQALHKTYGRENLWCESPSFRDMEIKGDSCFIRLNNVYTGLSSMTDFQGFEVAGADKVFHPAVAMSARKKGKETILVISEEVKAPVAVRYAFKNWGYGNVKNSAFLPLFPFRTDNWE